MTSTVIGTGLNSLLFLSKEHFSIHVYIYIYIYIYIYLYHSYYGNSHVIKVIISPLNSSGYDIIPALLFLYFLWYKIVIPWQHRDYRTMSITALSSGLRPRELGQLSTIIPQNHGIIITYIYIYNKQILNNVQQ